MKVCQVCGAEYRNTGPAQKYCQVCGPSIKRKNRRRSIDAYRKRQGVRVGAGSGGAQEGPDNHQWKGGVAAYRRMKPDATYCERCGREDVGEKWSFVRHHRDYNRKNNHISNIEFLCKRCHQLEHNCQDNLPNKV